MRQAGRAALFLGTVLLLCSALSGCVANRAYREKTPVLYECAPERELTKTKPVKTGLTKTECPRYKQYSMAFVEFDDVGEMFRNPSEIKRDKQGYVKEDNTELGQTIQEIERINEDASSYPVFVVFIHGWHYNASESSGNVWGFRSALQSLALELNKPGSLPHPIMGIFIGWRGEATSLPVAKDFSFWNRKNAATRIPGAHLTETLRLITMAAKSNKNARCVVVGHSFGGLVLERSLTQAMVEMMVENRADIESTELKLRTQKISTEAAERERKDADERLQSKVRSRIPDLTVLLNEAGPATESKEFLTFLKDGQFDFVDNENVRYPLFLSLTSTGDTATHIIFPIGQFLGKHGLSTRKYEEQDDFGETDQNHYFLHTTANSPHLVNHKVERDNPAKSSLCKEKHDREVFLGDKLYYICEDVDSARHSPKNDTPYWVMQIPTEFVPDHSTVFKPELRLLLEAFIKPVVIPVSTARTLDNEPSTAKPPELKLQRRQKQESKPPDQKPGP